MNLDKVIDTFTEGYTELSTAEIEFANSLINLATSFKDKVTKHTVDDHDQILLNFGNKFIALATSYKKEIDSIKSDHLAEVKLLSKELEYETDWMI